MEYPKWKVLAWRYCRVFIAGILSVFTVGVISDLMGMEAKVGLNYGIILAVAAGFNALSKALRMDADKKYKDLVHKLPI